MNDIRELMQAYKKWLDEPCNLTTNKSAIEWAGEHDFIHKGNFPSKERIAMMLAFEVFKIVHNGAISSGARSPYGKSWHDHYKSLAMTALNRAGGVWND